MTNPDKMKSDDEARQERAKLDPVNFPYTKTDYPILEQFEMPEEPEMPKMPKMPSLLGRICCSCRKNKFKSKSKKSKSKKSKSKNNIGR